MCHTGTVHVHILLDTISAATTDGAATEVNTHYSEEEDLVDNRGLITRKSYDYLTM